MDKLIDHMEIVLSNLATRWRSRQATSEAEEIVRQYRAILRCMMELGYREPLDIDSELPDQYLPEEYLVRFGRKNPIHTP
jgi:hypothetical protein